MKDQKTKSYDEYMGRISQEKIPVYQPSLGLEELNNLKKVVESNWISEGDFTRQFESGLANLCERKYALAFTNATSALIAGMKALGIVAGDDVLVPSFAHSADPNSISAIMANPVFSDVDEDTLCLSVESIKNSLTDNTKAILFICAYGSAAGIEEVSSFCEDKDIHLINDCAPALYGRINGTSIASYGNFSVLSFFADKTITTGEGGMLLTDNSKLIEECNIYKHDGRRERGHSLIERRGFNFRITEFQSAVGVAQLDKGIFFSSKKQALLGLYRKNLEDVDQISIYNYNDIESIVPHRIVGFTENSELLIKFLVDKGIGSRKLFSPMHSQPCYNNPHDFPISEVLYEKGLELPSYPDLSKEDIRHICKTIKLFFD